MRGIQSAMNHKRTTALHWNSMSLSIGQSSEKDSGELFAGMEKSIQRLATGGLYQWSSRKRAPVGVWILVQRQHTCKAKHSEVKPSRLLGTDGYCSCWEKTNVAPKVWRTWNMAHCKRIEVLVVADAGPCADCQDRYYLLRTGHCLRYVPLPHFTVGSKSRYLIFPALGSLSDFWWVQDCACRWRIPWYIVSHIIHLQYL